MKKILITLSFLIIIIVTGCQCDLSHKHYYNDRGVCNCGDDIAEELIYSNNQYISIIKEIKEGEVYYYKFKAHGENVLDFYLEGDGVIFDRIEIRADNMLQSVAMRKTNDNKIYTYDKNLTNNMDYYLKVTYEGEGKIKLILK